MEKCGIILSWVVLKCHKIVGEIVGAIAADFTPLLHRQLRIDKGSPGGALHPGTSIHNYDSCCGILYIF